MDLILGPWADDKVAGLDPEALDILEALLGENDHDLYQWVTARIGRGGAQPRGPQAYDSLLAEIAGHAAGRLAG